MNRNPCRAQKIWHLDTLIDPIAHMHALITSFVYPGGRSIDTNIATVNLHSLKEIVQMYPTSSKSDNPWRMHDVTHNAPHLKLTAKWHILQCGCHVNSLPRIAFDVICNGTRTINDQIAQGVFRMPLNVKARLTKCPRHRI